jgi:hypothetical protein
VRILLQVSLKQKKQMSYHVNEKAIMVNLEPTFLKCYIQMLKSYIKLFKITAEPSFQAEFDSLLEYVGRPTLYFAERLSKNTIQKYI